MDIESRRVEEKGDQSTMSKSALVVLLNLLALSVSFGESEEALLLRHPSVSRTQVVFSYADTLWIASREGGDARRLTASGHESNPVFSPDGTLVAFTGEYDGNQDVYVVPATGGVPRRLTYHPGPDEVVGWTPDGKQVLFASMRKAYAYGVVQLFVVPFAGGFPSELPLARAVEGTFSPNGTRLAYVPIPQWQRAWKRYRGGQTKPIWIANLADSSIEAKIPRNNSNDFNPMWVGNTVYFLSDRNGPVTLFAYNTESKEVKQVVKNDGFDIKAASAGPGAIVYEQFGSLHLLDLDSGRNRKLDFRVVGDITEVRPHFQKIEPKRIQSAGISPSGARAVFAARGEILTVPARER
jgi:tricorn protease